MKKITEEIKNEIKNLVYQYLTEECEVEEVEISDETHLIDDLDGDSLMLLELVELLKKKYNLSIQMQTLGKYLLKRPVNTIGEIIETSFLIYEKENDLVL